MAIDKSAMTLLVVDDSPTMRRVLIATLEDQGFAAIVHASDGLEAWNKVCAEKIDLVLCDYKMPKMSGMRLLQEIRANYLLKKMPFIMITSEADLQTVQSAVDNDVSGYIAKPFDPDSLISRIDKVLGQKG